MSVHHRAATSIAVVVALLGASGARAPASAQGITLLAAGDIEWSRTQKAPVSFSLPSTTVADMEIGGVRTPSRWISLPLLNVPENRTGIEQLLGRTLAPPVPHGDHYDLRFANIQEDIRHPFQRVRDLVLSADIAFANLEMPLSRRPPAGAFAGPLEFPEALTWAGFDIVSTANNHAFDAGEEGLLETMKRLDAAGVARVGSGINLEDARKSVIIERNGIRIAFLAYTWSVNVGAESFVGATRSGVMPLDPLLVKEDIRRVRNRADFVAVSFHWNIENTRQTHPAARDFAHAIIDAGADIILGHHPHKPQGIEVYKGKVIFYSLGNFIFGHTHDYWGDGFLARLTITPQRVTKVEVLPLAGTGDDLAQPFILTGTRAAALLRDMREFSAGLGTTMVVNGDVGVITVPAVGTPGGVR